MRIVGAAHLEVTGAVQRVGKVQLEAVEVVRHRSRRLQRRVVLQQVGVGLDHQRGRAGHVAGRSGAVGIALAGEASATVEA